MKNGKHKHRRVESLLNMGFDKKQSLNALRLNNNNVERAIEYLLHNMAKSEEENLDDFVLVNDEEERKKDLEWEQITFKDLRNHSISPWDMELQNEYECTLLSPFKLKQIISKCPTRTHLYKWRLGKTYLLSIFRQFSNTISTNFPTQLSLNS